MALKYELDSLDDVPETKRDEYVLDEASKKYRLQVEGAVPADRLKEFRENNKKLQKEREELLEKFKDVDPAEYRTIKERYKDVDLEEIKSLREELAALKESEGKGKEATKAELQSRIDDLVKKHKKEIESQKAELQKQIEGLNGQVNQQSQALAKALIDNQITTLGVENSVRPEAMPDVMNRGNRIFSLGENGQVVARCPDGSKWISDATEKYITVAEWFKGLVKDAPHLFKESSGSGASGGSAKGGGTSEKIDNPWKTQNRTQQALIIKDDIQRARRLAKEAGAKVLF